jgi:hypothetical protein
MTLTLMKINLILVVNQFGKILAMIHITNLLNNWFL